MATTITDADIRSLFPDRPLTDSEIRLIESILDQTVDEMVAESRARRTSSAIPD